MIYNFQADLHGTGSRSLRSRAYSKRAVQPICAVQDAICAVHVQSKNS